MAYRVARRAQPLFPLFQLPEGLETRENTCGSPALWSFDSITKHPRVSGDSLRLVAT
jgi:hypothetical protein